MEYLQQLEFDFRDDVINNTEQSYSVEPEKNSYEYQGDILKKNRTFVNILKASPDIRNVSIKNMERKIGIDIEPSNGKKKTFWALPSILEANGKEVEVIMKIFTHKQIMPSLCIPIVKKYQISRPCHWKLKWITDGKYHNLQQYYDKLNREYFGEELKNKIYWYNRKTTKNGRKRNSGFCLGFLCRGCYQIFINSLLDDYKIPEIIVEVVVYHEMVHAYLFNDPVSNEKLHGKRFKELYLRHPYVKSVEEILRNHMIYKVLNRKSTKKL